MISESDYFKNLNSIKHLNSRPPKQAYLFFPKNEEIAETIKHKNTIHLTRKLFEGSIKYNDFENNKFSEFLDFCKKYKTVNIPNSFTQFNWSYPDIYRFLLSYSFDFEKTLNGILEYNSWALKYKPVQLNENLKQILLSGFIYIHGRDNRFRPIIILRPNIFLTENKKRKISYEDWMLTVIYLLDYLISYLLIPGQVESWNIICDMKDVSIYSIPAELKNILTIIQTNYKFRLHAMYIINLSGFANILWGLIKNLMGESIQKKIKMINSSDNYKELYENINPSQLENRYCGLAEDINTNYESFMSIVNFSNPSLESGGNINKENSRRNSNSTEDLYSMKKFYFPPNMPSKDYFTDLDKDNINDILVTESVYLNIVMNNSNVVKSPFLIDKKMKEKEISCTQDNYVLDNDEKFYSCRDYFKNDSSSFLGNTAEMNIFNEEKKIKKKIEEIENEKINFKKNDYNNFGNVKIEPGKNLIDLEKNIFKKDLENNKVKIIKNNKNKSTFKKNNLMNDSSFSEAQDIELNKDDDSKKCKVSCGKVKMECLMF